jgi:hypothetical protein
MRQSNWSPSIVPNGNYETVYLVVDDFGHFGRAWRETDIEATDLEAVITDLLNGQYNDPVRVVGFNTAEGWSRDVSEDIADEIRRRCDLQMTEVPPNLEGFIERHESRDRRQLALRLV